MNFSMRIQILISVCTLLLVFALGRYSVSQPHITTSNQKSNETQIIDNKDTHTQTKITETRSPDGTSTKTTVIDTQVTDKKDLNKQVNSSSQTESTPQKTNTLNLSVMAGYDAQRSQIVYGGSVTKELVGPITMGLFGLTNGVVGATIGLNF